MDVARTARRLGADDAIVVYRRTRAQMPADAIEVDEAIAEGVRMHLAVDDRRRRRRHPHRREDAAGRRGTPAADGRVRATGGRRGRPRAGAGRRPRACSTTLPDLAISDGVVEVGPDMMTGAPGVFAAGDVAPSSAR